MQRKQFARIQARSKQKGVTILQILIGTVVGALALVASIAAVQGQRADAQLAEGSSFITTELPQALSSYYYLNNRSYAGIAVSAAFAADPIGTPPDGGAAMLRTRYNLRGELPWGNDAWRVSTAGNRTSVSLQFQCDSMDATAANALIKCEQLRNTILAANSSMLPAGACTAPTAANLFTTCTFTSPA